MNFDSFIGNRKIIERLRTKLRESRFPHALIFSGPEGVGKRTCALMTAKALNCPAKGPGDFCDECSSCRKINANTHPDVITVGLEDDATQIKIAQVRQLLATLDLHPLEGKAKVFVIDPANFMNAEAANALLKGLEEPPENSFFILIAVNVHELLLTVRSRCQVYNFTPLSLAEIRDHGVSDELVVRWSQGSIGQTRNIDPVRLKRERETVLDFAELALTAREDEFQDLLRSSADMGRAKDDFAEKMGILTVVLRDLLYLKENIPQNLVNTDLHDRLAKLANKTSVERLIAMSEFLGFVETSLKNHINRQMLTDVLSLLGNETTSRWMDIRA